MDLPGRVWAFIEDMDLLRPGATVVLGVSGGPDSLCLLDLLHARAGEADLKIHVAHLNHGLRPEAAAEAEFVRAQAEKRGCPFHTETVDTRASAAARHASIEEAARELRYNFLARTARAAGAALIAVAHTADDQAETVLMHFLRGSGLAGLRGMLPKSPVPSPQFAAADSGFGTGDPGLALIRPLLSTPRSDVEAYCSERGLTPVHDATNFDTTFFRNRLRHQLLPELEKYNPNIRAVLRRTADVAAGEHELLAAAQSALWAPTANLDNGRVTFDRLRWLTLSVPEQRALLRQAVHGLLPGRRDIDFTPLEHAVQFSRSAAPGRECDVLGGLRLLISYTTMVLAPWGAALPEADLPLLDAQGVLPGGWKFCAEPLAPGDWTPERIAAGASRWSVFAAGPGPFRLRPRRPGDRFHPLGLGGHSVKVADFMINEKIDEAQRDRWPLVLCREDIVWLAGLRLDERFKVTPGTSAVVRLSFVKETPHDE